MSGYFQLKSDSTELRAPKPLYVKAIAWARKYGDPFTVWVGNRPFVVASTKESFAEMGGPLRNLVADRPRSRMNDLQMRGHNVSPPFKKYSKRNRP